jgi:putative redox protein
MKKRAKITGVQITVDGEQAGQPPYVFTKIHIHYAVTGFGIKTNDVEKAIKLSKEKYCSVSQTLEPTVEITYDFEVIEAEQ